ncbi:MAG: RNA polymerase sigma factor [Eubacteriales bacterium]
MKREQAEKITTEYLKSIYGFALKRCSNLQDAEDLTQEIVLKAFRALIAKDDIEFPDKFIWTVAHNALNNYYRDRNNFVIGVPVDEMSEFLLSGEDVTENVIKDETAARLHSEIAYLSKSQRRIVIAYYFENKKQEVIAAELGIPLGTVKWHLFESKKDLKKGMVTMRQASELKFNPITFHSYGINGSIGTKTMDSFFRSVLSQNISYCVRKTPKTVNEIAEDLGVSPVYVESEAEYLEEYGFLLKKKDKYIINFLLTEPTAELLILQNNIYKKAAVIFANELYDELIGSGIVDDPRIICYQTDKPITLTESERTDRNFILWSLILYIAAMSGEKLMDNTISFEEAATIRPDGAHNICHATVVSADMVLPDDYVYMRNWCGPSYNCNDFYTLWRIDSEWSESRIHVDKSNYEDAMRVLSLYDREKGDVLAKDEYAWLAERGYIKTNGYYDGMFKSAWQIITLADTGIKNSLIAIGDRVKEKHKAEFDSIKAFYIESALKSIPEHLRKMRAYELQFIFYSDGWFLLHCMNELVNNGKMKLPTEKQKKSISTIIIPNK